MKKLIFGLLLVLTSCAPMYVTATPTPGPAVSIPTPPARFIKQSTHRPAGSVPAGETASATIEPQCVRVIAPEALHIRSEPSERSQVIGYAVFNQHLTMIQAGAWSKIQTTDQLTGFVNSKYIQEGCAP